MGSCLSSESRSPGPESPAGLRRRKSSKRKLGSHNSFDYKWEEILHRTPGRIFLNGSSEIASLFSQQGKKGINQDAMIVWENFGSRTGTVFCGVFDGHGPYGHKVAKRVRDSLPLKLSSHWEVDLKSVEAVRDANLNATGSFGSEGTSFASADEEARRTSAHLEENRKQLEIFETLKESFVKAFKVMDRELRIHANIDCFCSGTTAVTLVKQGCHLVLGNVGDSRAVLATRDENDFLTAVQLTVDLKPNLPVEAERIRKCKGRVFSLRDEPEVARVWLPNNDSPGLAMARAFGDFCLKDFGLISVPEMFHRRITDKDEFVVLASDGIWDVLSNKEVVDIVGWCPTRSQASRVLVETAVKAWRSKYPTSKVDDCAAVCLFLHSNDTNSSPTRTKPDITHSLGENTEPKDALSEPKHAFRSKIGEGDEEYLEAKGEIEDDKHAGQNGLALEWVSRADTLVSLPRFSAN